MNNSYLTMKLLTCLLSDYFHCITHYSWVNKGAMLTPVQLAALGDSLLELYH